MPYGKDFLDTLDWMLLDDGKTSKEVENRCSICYQIFDKEAGTWYKKDGLTLFDLKQQRRCNACAKAQINDFSGGLTGPFELGYDNQT